MPELNTTLTVNDTPIDLSHFPREFLTRVVLAAVATLKKVDRIQQTEVSFYSGKTAVTVNGQIIPLGPFPSTVIHGTLRGLITALAGVDGNFESYQITIG